MKKKVIVSFFISLGFGFLIDITIKENILNYPQAQVYYNTILAWSHLDFVVTISCITLWFIYWVPYFFRDKQNPDNYELKFDSKDNIKYD